MDKPIIPKEAGLFKKTCNEAFHGFKSVLPEKIRETEKYDPEIAEGLGMISGYATASMGGKLIKILNQHGFNINLEKTTSYCVIATAAAEPIAKLIAPDYVQKFYEENPRYSRGVKGLMKGAILKGLILLYSKK